MLKKISLISVLALLLVACAKSLPSDKMDYAGTWESKDRQMLLTITQEGRLQYQYDQPGKSRSLDAPIKEFNGADFSAGVGPMTTDFVVSQTPTQNEQGEWIMVVDGKTLIKHE